VSQGSIAPQPLTPLHLLERSAHVYGTKTAIVYGDLRYSYAELATRVERFARALAAAGVQKGDRVAVLAFNTPALLEAHFAVPMAGAILVAINTRLTAEEVTYILQDSEAKVLVVDSDLLHLVRRDAEADLRCIVVTAAPGAVAGGRLDYEDFLARAQLDDTALPALDELDPIAINYTSGTTGRPKGVVYTHRGAYLNAIAQVLTLGLDSSSNYLWTLPMFHCNGWCCTWGVTAAGGTHVCLRRVEPANVWDLVVREHVTHLNGAPTVLIGLFNHPAAQARAGEGRLRIATGGAPPSPTLIAQAERSGAEITHMYGLTETYGPFTWCEWQAPWNKLGPSERARIRARQGVPHLLAGEVRVVDDEMRDVPADGLTMGEIVVRGNVVMQGYYRQPEATAEAFRGGWFHTGDLGVLHQDGYLELRDRKKDVIISGGETISTVEVEQAVAAHPAVLEVAVVAVPHDYWGEVPKAFVTLRPGTTAAADEIIAFTRERIAHFKCPRFVEFSDLPKTSTGKIQKYALREREWAGRDLRIH